MKKPAKVIIWILGVIWLFLILDVIFILFGKTIVAGRLEDPEIKGFFG